MAQIITIEVPGPQGPPGPPGGEGGGAADHGLLSGLLDDDHPQYHNNTRGDARYSLIAHEHDAVDITDSTTVGRSVLTAIDETAARTAIGAGTASTKSDVGLANVDNTSDTDKPVSTAQQTALDAKSDIGHTHTASNISDSTTVGRSVLTAVDAAAARTAIGAGTSSLTIGTTNTTAKAGDYQPASADISDSTATGRSLITATDATAARTITGAAAASHTHGVTDLTATGTRDATTFLRGDNTWAVPAGGGGGWTAVDASETVKGIAEIATTTETNTGTDDARIVTPLKLKGVADTKANTSITVSAGTGLTGGGDLSANRTLTVSYGSASGTAVQGNDARVTADQAAGTASIRTIGTGALQAAAGNHTHTAANISDSTAVGRSVLTAVDAAAARTAIGAGTSSLTLGTTNTTAKAGDYQPTAANISDSTATGRSVLTATDAAAARTAIGAGTSNLAIGTTSTTAKAGDYAPPTSSETVSGLVELATAAETTTGTDNTRAVHPAGLKVELDKKVTAFTDPNADRIVFWDDSAGSFVALAHSAPINITGTTLTVDASTEAASGIVELATAAETTTGTDNTRAVHPAGLKVELDKKTNLLLTTTTQTGTTYTYAIGDAGTQVLHNNASAITATVPPNSSVAFSIGTSIVARQYGAGQVTIAPGAGVTLRSRGGALKTAGQYGGLTLTKINTDEWIVEGDATT